MSRDSKQLLRVIDSLIDTDPLILRLDMPVQRAAAQLANTRTAAAPVTDDSGKLHGILTQKDCFRPALQASYYQTWKGSVGDFMSADVFTLPSGTDLVSAATAFLEHPYRSLPVLDGNRLAGMLYREEVFCALIQAG